VESIERVNRVENRFFPSNTYFLGESGSDGCIIIDPGVDFERIHSAIKEHALRPVGIVCTHGHFDHVGCIAALKRDYPGIPYALHEADLKLARSANFFAKLAKLPVWIEFVKPDLVMTGQSGVVNVGTFKMEFELFPGHSDGSCVIKHSSHLFGGDLIYRRGVGFNNFPGENKTMLKSSIQRLMATYDHDLMVYPGHGESGKLGWILQNNAELNRFLNEQ